MYRYVLGQKLISVWLFHYLCKKKSYEFCSFNIRIQYDIWISNDVEWIDLMDENKVRLK